MHSLKIAFNVQAYFYGNQSFPAHLDILKKNEYIQAFLDPEIEQTITIMRKLVNR